MPLPEERPAAGAIVIVAYQGAGDLRAALDSCRMHAPDVDVIVVDNASTDGSAEIVATEFPEAVVLRQARNRGFGGGCNAGIRAARDAGASWVMLLNQDATLEDGTVAALAGFLAAHPGAAAVQPALFRDDGLCNSLGNPMHYLGFSTAGGNGVTVEEAERDPTLPWLRDPRWRSSGVAVPVCSGAAVMLRMAALDDVGLFEEELFLYHEDLELAVRLRRAGWTLHLLGAVRVVHHYRFSRNPQKMYHLERNRQWVVLAHYRVPTLALIAPPLLAAEVMVWAVAVRQGWAGEKWAAYRYWLLPGSVRHLRARRRAFAARRRCSDRDLLAMASGRFVATEMSNPLIDRLANPASAVAWWAVRRLLRW